MLLLFLQNTPPEIKIEKDYVRKRTHWFRAKNIQMLKLDGIHIIDNNNYLSQWEGGVFQFDNCNGKKLTDVTINDLPMQENTES